jgi:hypothetical protein
MELLGSSSGAEGLGNRKFGYGSDGLDTQSALASSVCHRLLGSNRHQGGEMLSGDEEPRRYVGSSPTPSEQISPELLPNSFTFKVAKTFPELWERYKLACAQERKGES